MPIRKIQFENGEFYHVFNRGVEKRRIFMNNKDYLRFIKNINIFNDDKLVLRSERRLSHLPYPGYGDIAVSGIRRDPFVNIVCFCLMPNHYHLLIQQLSDNGLSRFLGKVCLGYVHYFNTKYERVGSLFQGRFKAVHIDNDEQLKHTSRYIHLNPVELIENDWKEKGIENWNKTNEFLENYRWSSYLDYIGKNNFSSVTNREFVMQYFDNKPEKYKKYINEWFIDDLKKIDVLD
ncbi:MAG: transposase [Patescibacteria group bacterium]